MYKCPAPETISEKRTARAGDFDEPAASGGRAKGGAFDIVRSLGALDPKEAVRVAETVAARQRPDVTLFHRLRRLQRAHV